MNSILICDLLEVTIITVLLYHCFVWLDQNKKKELLKPVLVIIFLNTIGWIGDLKALQLLFFYLATPGVIIYYLVNQQSLKKSNSTKQDHDTQLPYKNSMTTQIMLESLIQEAIYGLFDNKNIVYVFEQKISVENLITPSLYLHTKISKDIIKFFIRSTDQHQTCSFLINNNYIIGYQVPFFDDCNFFATHDQIQELVQPCIIDTDTIIVIGFHSNHTWALLHKEYGYFDVTTKELFKILHYFFNTGEINSYEHTKNDKTHLSQHSL